MRVGLIIAAVLAFYFGSRAYEAHHAIEAARTLPAGLPGQMLVTDGSGNAKWVYPMNRPSRWRVVASMSGNDEQKTTPTFNVRSSDWLISYSVYDSGNNDGLPTDVTILLSPQPAGAVQKIAQVHRPVQSSVQFNQPGEYTLSVFGFGTRWAVTIVEQIPE